MKIKFMFVPLLLTLSMNIYSAEKDDVKVLDELYKQKKYEAAISQTKIFIDKYPQSKLNKVLLGKIAKTYYLQNNYSDTIKFFKVMLLRNDLSKDDKNMAYFFLAKSYAYINDVEKSEEYLDLLKEQKEIYEQTMFDVASIYLNEENYNNAERLFKQILNQNNKYKEYALFDLGLVNYNRGDYQKAVEYFNLYINDTKGDKNILTNYLMATSYYKINNISNAISYFNKVILNEKDKNKNKALLSLVEIYSNEGQINNALAEYNKIDEENYRAEGLRIIGNSYSQKGEYEKAVNIYKQIHGIQNPNFLYNYGFALYKLERFKEANYYFESLKNTDLYGKSVYYILASDFKLKNYDEILNRASNLKNIKMSKSERTAVNLIIGDAAYEIGNYNLASEYYSDNLNDKISKDLLYKLIIVESKRENISEAEKYFNEYVDSYGLNNDYGKNIVTVMGEMYSRDNKNDEAESIYLKYLNYKQDEDIKIKLTSLMLSQKKYEQVLSLIPETTKNLGELYNRGVALLGSGNYNDADNIFNQLDTNTSISSELKEKVEASMIRSLFLQGKYKEATEYSNLYFTKFPEGESINEIRDKIAISYFRLDQFDKSRELYNILKDKSGYQAYAIYQIADTYNAEDNLQLAMENYKIVMNMNDQNYSELANYWFLNCLYKLNRVNEFDKEKKLFIEKYPNSKYEENIYIISENLYGKEQDMDKLIDNYKKLYSLSKDNDKKDELSYKIVNLSLSQNNTEDAKKYIENINDPMEKSYLLAKLYIKMNNKEESVKEYLKLTQSAKYREEADLYLGNYYFTKKDYIQSKKYYEDIKNIGGSKIEDYAIYQLALIDELQNKTKEALSGFIKGYSAYNGMYSLQSKLKAAQLYEKLNKNVEAKKLYIEILKDKNLEYQTYSLERLIYISLKAKNISEGKKYYEKLNKINRNQGKKYDKFFK